MRNSAATGKQISNRNPFTDDYRPADSDRRWSSPEMQQRNIKRDLKDLNIYTHCCVTHAKYFVIDKWQKYLPQIFKLI